MPAHEHRPARVHASLRAGVVKASREEAAGCSVAVRFGYTAVAISFRTVNRRNTLRRWLPKYQKREGNRYGPENVDSDCCTARNWGLIDGAETARNQ